MVGDHDVSARRGRMGGTCLRGEHARTLLRQGLRGPAVGEAGFLKERIMSRRASARQFASGIVALAALALVAGAAAQTATSRPDLSSNRTAWKALNGADYIAVPGSPSPITNDPAHPHVG